MYCNSLDHIREKNDQKLCILFQNNLLCPYFLSSGSRSMEILRILHWGAEVTTEKGKYLALVNTCACYYSIHHDLLIEIRNSKVNVLSNIYATLANLLSGNYNEATYSRLMCCKESVKVVKEEVNAEGSEKVLSLIPLKQCFERISFFTVLSYQKT